MKKILEINNNVIRDENGAASTLVLFTVLMFLLILSGTYMVITTRQEAQIKSDMRIQDLYKEDDNKIYNSVISDRIYSNEVYVNEVYANETYAE